MNGHPRRHIQTIRLGPFQCGQGACGGDLIDMIPCTGHFDQGHITVQPHAFGHCRDRWQPTQRCEFARCCRGPL